HKSRARNKRTFRLKALGAGSTFPLLMRVFSLILLCAFLCPARAITGENDGELAGTVVDDDGKPIEGVLADAWTWYKGNEATTDKAGHFHIKNIETQFNNKAEVRFTKG